MDNKLIDTYYANRVDIFTSDEKDMLQADEFLHFISLANKDLQFILDLSFTQFWALMARTPDLSRFLDEFLQNMRKHNDIFKVEHLYQFDSNRQPSKDIQDDIRS